MPVRAVPAIRRILGESPGTRVEYVGAIAPESVFLSAQGPEQVLFVNPVHRELVETLTQARS
ncbi:MAG: chemotaxis protein CheY [Microbacterium sp.]|uniref:chemotaxis protein CheY n=1 Tax=Microbacterium sp. TaxID=51671 RepID=UPI001AC32F6F|nr:chemotaxis protein CheY [Microbacterium sp.]MBN9155763.1 chemotaxis protein CheY [Microbacterium sp.]MBN9195688.1 chemotaxis protein CheY [Microbacterium sp.]